MTLPKPTKSDASIMLGAALVAAALAVGLVWTWTEHPELLEHAYFKRI